ncbi:MAG: hypothetical protein AB7N80_15025 [Bdellovibrionales bacterium]
MKWVLGLDLRPAPFRPSVGVGQPLCYSWAMAMAIRSILCFLALVLPFISAAEGAVGNAAYVMCRSQKTVRTIRVIEGGETCTTIYTKAGIDKIVGNGKNRQSCHDVMKNIRTNLEGAAWKCKDISSSRVTEETN